MQNEVESLSVAWQEAWFAKDALTIAQLMAPDYVYVAPNGTVMDRATILEIVRDPTYVLTGGQHTEVLVVMLGDNAALVRRRWQGTGTFRGQTFVEDHRCATILDRTSGRWCIRYEHSSAVGS